MITGNSNLFNSPVRTIMAKAELYIAPAFASPITYTANDDLKEITLDRVGESKFFGFGVSQKENIKLLDVKREKEIKAGSKFIVSFNDVALTPVYVTEVHRDEKTNELSITAYDVLYSASAHYFDELVLEESYSIYDVAIACADALSVSALIDDSIAEAFELSFSTGANFEGTETLREVLNAIAEATQTIYFINHNEELVFKRFDVAGEPVATIDKEKYIELDSKTNRRLSAICSATELGDNVTATLDVSGTTQFVRDNPFWDLREDIDVLVEAALARVGGLTINQFNCSWRGNPLIEIGDKIGLVTKDNEVMYSYLVNDTIEYNGGFAQKTEWSYTDTEETASNPSTLGDVLKQTYAKVDKANKEITLVANETKTNSSELATLIINTSSINASVSSLETKVNNSIDGINDTVTELSRKVNATMTDEEIEFLISSKMSEGVNSVETSTGFTFNEDGLKVTKSDSSISTTITEDGMTVKKGSSEVLTANNEGVKAIDLHAITYLVIGKNSRFEDYGSDRTGCFWIGG